MRHDNRRGEEHQQQGAPGAFLQRRVQRGEGSLVLQQPQFQLLRAVEHAIQGVQPDTAQCNQLDQRFEGDGEYQPCVLLTGCDVSRAKENSEQGDQRAKRHGHPILHRFAGQNADGIGHCLNLQGQQRQYADQHEYGGQRTSPGAAKAEGKQIGQR